MILLISYDLIDPGQDYSGLYEEIKAADAWWHHLDSTWIISTESGPDECRNVFASIWTPMTVFWSYK